MPISITLPAVTRPRRRTEILTRPRLLDLLYEILERKLILVVAPAGYGKTTLLIDFAHQKDISACWYTVDRHDTSLMRFLAHLVAAISRVYPAFGASSRAAIESLERPGSDLEHLLTTLVNDLYEHVDQHFVLVLDDFHFVSESPEIHSFLSRFIARVDENCHLILASRQEISLPDFDLLQARGQAARITLNDLAFKPAEIQSLSQAQKHALTAEQATEISERMGGWITGILLTEFNPLGGKLALQPGSRGKADQLASYWDILIADQPGSVQDFLLYSSLFDAFNAELCEAVLSPSIYPHRPDWDELFSSVLKHNLFVISSVESSGWLRYHSLFREYLSRRLSRVYPGVEGEILRNLAAFYRERKQWQKAVNVCLQLKDHELLVDTIEQAGPTLVKYGRYQTLTSWLEAVPPGLLRSHPGMLSLQGCAALIVSKPRQGLTLFCQADALLRAADDRPRLARNLARRSTAHYYLGDYLAALQDAEEALAVLGNSQALPGVRAEALKNRGICLHSLGKSQEGIRYLEGALAVYEALQDSPGMAELSVELGIAYRSMGDMQSAEKAYLRAEAFWRKEGNYLRLSDLLNNLGVYYHHAGQYERAVEAFDEGLKHARTAGFARLEAFILASLGDLYFEMDALPEAHKVYEESLPIAHKLENRFLLFYLPYSLARLARKSGEFEKAQVLLDQAAQYSQTDSRFEQGSIEMETARVALSQGRNQDAAQLLLSACKKFQEGNLFAEEVQALLHLSQACFNEGEGEKACEYLQLAFSKSPAIQDAHTLIIAGRDARTVLEYAVEISRLERPARSILEKLRELDARFAALRKQLRKAAPGSSQPCQPKVILRAFGEVEIEVNGKKFRQSDWKSNQQKEVLFYLIQQPNGASKEKLLSLFWQEPDPHGTQLSNMLYKLKQFLGVEIIQHSEGRYFFNPSLDYEYDVERFQEAEESARKAADIHAKILAYEQMVNTYGGYFLLEAERTWAIPERERLHQKYLNAVSKLIELYLSQANTNAGQELYWQAQERDPHWEEIYRLGMRVYAAIGDRAKIDYQYQLCKQILWKVFGLEPSEQTKNLHKQLMN